MNTKWEHLKMTTYLRFCQRLCTASQVLVKTKDHWLWLVCMCVWTESWGRKISWSLKFNQQIVLQPPCTGQCKSDWPPTKHRAAPKRQSDPAVKMVQRHHDCGHVKKVNLFQQNLTDLHLFLQRLGLLQDSNYKQLTTRYWFDLQYSI